MQDIHSIGGGRLFGGGRLRPQPFHQNHQALKCPRCDSLNTKFCYYNNYNLSQPRHFCKSCRRYWTKGGVLRNVPVGGGCRKNKSNSKPIPNSESSDQTQRRHEVSVRRILIRVVKARAILTVTSVNSSRLMLNSMNDSNTQCFGHARGNNGNSNNDTGYDQPVTTAELEHGSSDCWIFSEIGSFKNLITSSNEVLPFGFGNLLNNAQQNLEHVKNEQWQQHHNIVSGSNQESKMQEITSGLLDQTVQVELSTLQDRSGGNGGFGSLDWQGSGDQGLFDHPNAVDHESYFHWTD